MTLRMGILIEVTVVKTARLDKLMANFYMAVARKKLAKEYFFLYTIPKLLVYF